jgi:hypothetical protein
MSRKQSTRFLNDLAEVYSSLRPPSLSSTFLSDLKQVYSPLSTTSEASLQFLARRFDDWRRKTCEFVSSCIAELDDDDPLLCRISLFRTMEAGRLETAHTRTLAWILDPAKSEQHGFGDALLAALLRHLAGRDHLDRLHVKRVAAEYSLEGVEGRLDVLAEGKWERPGETVPWVLVIEAKIDAAEGEGQLDKYDKWLEVHSKGKETYRVFLTIDGRSSDSGCDEWRSLSFRHLVQIFRSVYSSLQTAPGFHFLRYYLAGVLQDICGFPSNVEKDAIDPYVVASYLESVLETRSEVTNHDTAR